MLIYMSILRTIEEIFAKKFRVTFDNNLYTIKSNNLKCLELKISIDEIQIIDLDRCNSTGIKLLELVEKLAKKMGITRISLLDVSKINIECLDLSIDLSYLKFYQMVFLGIIHLVMFRLILKKKLQKIMKFYKCR